MIDQEKQERLERLRQILRSRPLPKRKPPEISDDEWKTMQEEHAARERALDDNLLGARERAFAVGTNDGRGACTFCGTALIDVTYKGQIVKSHPNPDACPGPPQRCEDCGHEWRRADPRTWEPCPKCATRVVPPAKKADAPIEMKPIRHVTLFGDDS